jgi:hypothetical protein
MHDDTERWRRLTILDILCLFPSFAMGAATVRYLMEHPSPKLWDPRPWPMDAGSGGLLFVGLVLGSVYAAPVSLAVQFVFRRRRVWLSVGECLWIEPFLLCFVTLLTSCILPESPTWAIFAISWQFTFSIIAFMVLAFILTDLWMGVACFWTEIFGCVSCTLMGVLIIYFSIVTLNVL